MSGVCSMTVIKEDRNGAIVEGDGIASKEPDGLEAIPSRSQPVVV